MSGDNVLPFKYTHTFNHILITRLATLVYIFIEFIHCLSIDILTQIKKKNSKPYTQFHLKFRKIAAMSTMFLKKMQLKRFKLVAIYYNLIRFSSLVPILTNINYYININLQRKKKEETIL